MPFVVALIAFVAVWLSSSAMRRKGTMTVGAQRALLLFMIVLVAATFGFQWWSSHHPG